MTKGTFVPVIRQIQVNDWQSVWPMLREVFRRGETYAYSPDISETEAYRVWVETPLVTYVAVDGDEIVGTYYLKPNQPELGAHVCNCGYIVSEQARGKGVASLMCKHSQAEARLRGFKAMQYNLVVSTNKTAVALWEKLGFAQVGVLPNAFNHKRLGYVDALVMYKELV
ncbi:GNAT family N-acetyltransferase [Pseudomonadota bacterium]